MLSGKHTHFYNACAGYFLRNENNYAMPLWCGLFLRAWRTHWLQHWAAAHVCFSTIECERHYRVSEKLSLVAFASFLITIFSLLMFFLIELTCFFCFQLCFISNDLVVQRLDALDCWFQSVIKKMECLSRRSISISHSFLKSSMGQVAWPVSMISSI